MAKSISVTDLLTDRTAVVNLEDIANEEEREDERAIRVKAYQKYWLYYDTEQAEKANKDTKTSLRKNEDERLPEHLRLHAYSGVIAEGIDFITDQLMDNMSIEVKSNKEVESGEADPEGDIPEEQKKFQDIWDISDMDLEAPDLTREALVSADSFIVLKWDEAEKIVKLLPYDAQSISPIYSSKNHKRMLMATIYSTAYSEVEDSDIEVREQYVLAKTSEGYQECVYLRYEGDTEAPVETALLNIPFIPIVHLRAIRKKLRRSFGESLVKKVMGDVDRFDAVSQLEFQIGRYNSHSHLALFGDESRITGEQLFLGGEANDFWAFPATTEAKVMNLPTDTTMIENQRSVIEKNMYKKMGIQKMDLEDIQGMGAPSGYSLEIMNRKTDGVFSRIQKELSKGYITVFSYALDMQAIMESGKAWWKVNPLKTYPNRTIHFTFGSIFVADSEQIRQDYVAGMISRKRALMLKGYSETDAMKLAEEVEDDQEAANAAESEGLAAILKKNKQAPDQE